ncbi:MARCKS-like protein [Burkholderia sp. 8Y]|uniref:MARCKS-like protein n=1 Tax=Burkholderia sp. 8Y TaxID=2653133 RepID=UPI0012F30382|nr:MARCKS-like protein [Burkholderia sp. 8Y]VXB39246.1 MARCKS-like protein [Burkholderia sp. 8Y]
MNQKTQAPESAAPEDGHIESQPIPGHTENIPTNPADDPKRGPTEDRAPDATPDTKPGTPPGTQSERDRLKTPEAGNPL